MGKLGQGVGALKRGGAGTPLQTMAMLFATATELLVRNRMLNQTSFVKGYLTRVIVGRGFGTQSFWLYEQNFACETVQSFMAVYTELNSMFI